jgi:hypothetical protein
MDQLIRIRTREEPAVEGEGPRQKAASPLRHALDDARSVLPWRDLGKPAPARLALYALVAPFICVLAPLLATLVLDLDARVAQTILGVSGVLWGAFGPSMAAFMVSGLFHALQGDDTRSRLHQALVCPYCRDEVERQGVVICARDKCGALYHRECWDECSKQYGGCAVYGCSAKRCREVSAAGYVLRIAKLLLAAALFPPRAVRALRNNETESAASIYRRAVTSARRIYAWTNATGGRQTFIVLLLGVPLSYVPVLAYLSRVPYWQRTDQGTWWFLACIFGIPFSLLAIPYLLAIPVVFTFFFAKAMKRALEAEFSALERADRGGGTVLGRLALGLGSKKG